jgi:predicted alpha-1,6-mannanase (GH76 family)
MKNLLSLILFITLLPLACTKDDPAPVHGQENTVGWQAAADSSSMSLIDNFWNGTGRYFNNDNHGNTGFQYWPQAHALDVMIDAYLRTEKNTYLSNILAWYEGVKAQNGNTFLNDYYDDMEWNALAMLRAYNASGDGKFKSATLAVWNDIKTGWNTQGNGGVAWRKSQPYSKNACSNGPACILAARLYQQFQNEEDKTWALKIYAWEKETLFNPANGAVYDNLNANTGEIKTGWIFTYNQGTFLGAALELYKITGEKSYLNDAVKAADYTLNNLVNSNDQVLKNEGSGDGALFKGVFVRYFTQLILSPDLTEGTRKRYVNFLQHNAETLWLEGTNKTQVLFGTYWKNKPGSGNELNEQISGAVLMEAAALLNGQKILK